MGVEEPLLADLAAAAGSARAGGAPRVPPASRFEESLDRDLSSWLRGGSENIPLLAAALWMAAEPAQAVPWWQRFFELQLDGATLTVGDRGNRIGFMHSEAGSRNYFPLAVIAVAAARAFAPRDGAGGDLVRTEARRYLARAWAWCALCAAPRPAAGQRAANGRPFWSGPFVAMAGFRSPPANWYQNSTDPLFARALGWPVATARRETLVHRIADDLMAGAGGGEGPDLGALGLSEGERRLLTGFVRGERPVDPVLSLLAGTHTVAPFHFLRWPDAVASFVEENRNGNTTCCYAVLTRLSTGSTAFLHPGPARQRRGNPTGFCRLLPSGHLVAGLDATEVADAAGINQLAIAATEGRIPDQPFQGLQGVELPAERPAYHVVIDREGVRRADDPPDPGGGPTPPPTDPPPTGSNEVPPPEPPGGGEPGIDPAELLAALLGRLEALAAEVREGLDRLRGG